MRIPKPLLGGRQRVATSPSANLCFGILRVDLGCSTCRNPRSDLRPQQTTAWQALRLISYMYYQSHVGSYKHLVRFDCAAKEQYRSRIVSRVEICLMPQSPWYASHASRLSGGLRIARCCSASRYGRPDGIGYCVGYFVLHGKHITEMAIVAVGPDVVSSLRVDKLRTDAHTIAAPAYAAFEHVAHPEFLATCFTSARALCR